MVFGFAVAVAASGSRVEIQKILMKLIRDIGQKVAAGGEHAIGHVSSKLSVWFGKMPGNFI